MLFLVIAAKISERLLLYLLKKISPPSRERTVRRFIYQTRSFSIELNLGFSEASNERHLYSLRQYYQWNQSKRCETCSPFKDQRTDQTVNNGDKHHYQVRNIDSYETVNGFACQGQLRYYLLRLVALIFEPRDRHSYDLAKGLMPDLSDNFFSQSGEYGHIQRYHKTFKQSYS